MESLLDFALLFESENSAGALRSLEEYQRLFPQISALLAAEYAVLSEPANMGHELPQPRIAHYILERELGSGGQGRVFLATDTRMRRQVALKVVNRATLTPDKLRRFQREVAVIAKLDHPGLCTVYEADLDAALPYLVMRFVDGQDLSCKLIAKRADGAEPSWLLPGSYQDLARLLHIFERTARSLHAAHEAGVVHRDIKPANIIVRGNDDPVIVDFGLARGDDPELAGLTHSDDVLGTPAYMAPELLESGHSGADRRIDVYALGIALYECLTLERPFRAEHREALFQSILNGKYANPRELNPIVSEDLRVVLATAMEHQLARRYATALEFAEDLRRVREYEPISAQRASFGLRARRWCQRNPRIALAAASLVGALGVWIGTLSYTLSKVAAQGARTRAANSRLLGVECREKSAAQLSTDPSLALVLAIEADRRDPGLESNMAVLRALLQRNEERTFCGGSVRFSGNVAVSPDGQQVLVPTEHCEAVLFHPDSSEPRMKSYGKLQQPARWPVLACFSPDGQTFCVSDETPRLCLLDSRSGGILRFMEGHSAALTSCAYSPDGGRMLTSSFDGSARIFDVATGALQVSFESPTSYFTSTQFDVTGTVVLTSKNPPTNGPDSLEDRDPRVWDARTGVLLATLGGHASPVREARFSRDGTLVVTAEVDGVVRGWDWRSSTQLWSILLPGQAWCLSLSPDGDRFAVGFQTGVRVFDICSGTLLLELSGVAERSVIALAFSPDSQWIAAADYGGNLGAWNSNDGVLRFRTSAASASLRNLAWLPDSRRFVTGGGASHARMWTIDPVPYLVSFRAHTGAVSSAVFSPDSQSVLSAGADGIARISAARDGSLLREFDTRTDALVRAWFVESARAVACLSRTGGVTLHDLEGDRARTVRTGVVGAVRSSAVSSDGEELCIGFEDGRVIWIDTMTDTVLGSVNRAGSPIGALCISPDNQRAAWGADDGWAGILERSTGTGPCFDECRSAIYRPRVSLVAFGSDSRRLLTCGEHGGVHEWDARTGEFLRKSGVRSFGALVMLPDKTDFIASANMAPQVMRLGFEALSVRWGLMQPSKDIRITSLRVNEAGTLILTASQEGTAQLSSSTDGAAILRYEHGQIPLTCAEFSRNGQWVVTAAEDGTLRVWPIDPVAVARDCAPSTADMWPLEIPKDVDER